MATVLKAGAIKIDLEANAKNLIKGFKDALGSLNSFGKGTEKTTSQAKRLDDQMKALERRKQLLTDKITKLNSANSVNIDRYKSLQNQLIGVNDRIGTQSIKMQELGGKVSKLPNLLGGLSNAFSSLGKIGSNAIKGLSSSIGRISEIAIGNILANAISKATGMLINFAKTAFGLTTDLQDARGGFEAMLGSADKAKSMLKDLSAYNKKTPFTLPQLQEQAANLLAVGVSAEKIIPTLDVLGKISRGNANRLSFLTLAYGQVQSATKLTGAELRQFTENGVPLLDLLAKQTGKSTAQMREDISDGAVSFKMVDKALQSTIQEGGRFYNYFEGQSKNFSFVGSNIIDQIQIIGRSLLGISEEGDVLSGGIFDKITTKAQELLNFLNKNKDGLVTFGQNIMNAFSKVVDVLFQFKTPLKDVLKTIRDFASDGENIKALFKTLGVVFGILAGVLVVINAPLLLAVGAFAGLFQIIRNGDEIFGNLKTRFDEIVTALTTYFKPEIDALKNIFNIFTTQILPQLINWFGIIAGVLVWVGANVIQALIYAWEQLREPVMQLMTSLFELWGAISPIITVVLALVGALIVFLMPALQMIWAFIVQLFVGVIQVLSGVITFIAGLFNIFVGIFEAVFTGDTTRIMNGFRQLWDGLVKFMGGLWTMIKSPVVAIIDGIKNTFASINLIQIGKDMIQGLINGISGMAGKVGEEVKKLGNLVPEQLKSLLGIKSPSRVLMQVGMDAGEGLEIGLADSQPNIEAQVSSMSNLIAGVSPQDGLPSNTTINKQRNVTINNYDSSRDSRFINFSTAFA
jgi:tape measure domain-containing protein